MKPIRNTPTPNLQDLTALFSRSHAQAVQQNEFTAILPKVCRIEHHKSFHGKTYLAFYRYAYQQLQGSYQNEYWVKNEMLKEWLIQEAKHGKAHISSEFRIGNSKADLAVFNGHAAAYEIKTALDSPERLAAQLADYSKGFHKVYLVVPVQHVSKYIPRASNNTGLIAYDENGFRKVKEVVHVNAIDKKMTMRSLRTEEYKRLVYLTKGYLPEMNSFNQFDICARHIQSLSQDEFENAYVRVLKERGVNAALDRKAYKEFNQLTLALKWSRHEKSRFINNLKQPINN